jgi:radical SAM superfamily enzyme YgiQ (UPF0313 family)
VEAPRCAQDATLSAKLAERVVVLDSRHLNRPAGQAAPRGDRPGPAGRPLRVVLVHTPDPNYADTQNYGAQFMPLWAYTLAAHIPDDGSYALSLTDTRLGRTADIAEGDVFLFSGINQDLGMILKVHAELKSRNPSAKFLIGGPICWSFDQAGDLGKLAAFDCIHIGDGEDAIASILGGIARGAPLDRVIRRKDRFDITQAKPLHRPLLDTTIRRYYGAVLEVSRGCPFLCEFCDIRVLPDNNRPHNLSADLIVGEIDHLCRLGVSQFLLACDNFIGEPRWAEELVDKLLAWQERTGHRPSLYTWLTINLYKHPDLMRKMRRAGFDMLFIGIESFNVNSLLETAKLQNSAASLTEVIRDIQAFGFVVVAGLIFGFDSDRDDAFDITLRGLLESGLLSGDPSLLTALPGTPLYRRMKLGGRLRDVRYGLGGYKYQTNIRYLLRRDRMIEGYRKFVEQFVEGSYQYERLKRFFANLERGEFIPLKGGGYGNLALLARMVFRNTAAMRQWWTRLRLFAARPSNLYYAVKGLGLVLTRRRFRGRLSYFRFWLFAWTNAVLKYQNLTERDFDIESVEDGFDIRRILPASYAETADEQIPAGKIDAQLRATTRQLEAVIERAALSG